MKMLLTLNVNDLQSDRRLFNELKSGGIGKNLRLNFKRGEHGTIIRGKVIKISGAFNIQGRDAWCQI